MHGFPANFLIVLRSHLDVTCSCYFWCNLRMNVVYSCSCSFLTRRDRASWFHRFLVSCVCRTQTMHGFPANLLTILHSHLDVACLCYFWCSLRMNVVYSCSCSFLIRKDRASRFHRFLVSCVCRIETMHWCLCSFSCRFSNCFAFTLGCCLFLLFLVQFKDECSVQL